MQDAVHCNKTLFTVTIDSVHVPLTAMGLWDSHPEGRTRHIIARSPRSQHMFLRKYFLQIDGLRCQLSENAQQCAPSADTRILQIRYMDNAYLTLCNVPTHTHKQLLKFVEMHQTVYNIKMKWETTGVHTDWCDARLSSLPRPNLTVKGVPCTPCGTLATSLRDWWPDR